MDRNEIIDGLRAVGQRLLHEGLQAAIALAYNTRRVTRDIDAVFEPKRQICAAAAVVAEDRGLDADWLNDSVKGLLRGPDPYRTSVFELPGLRVEAASPPSRCSRAG